MSQLSVTKSNNKSIKSAIALALFSAIITILVIEVAARLNPGLMEARTLVFPGEDYHVGTIPDKYLGHTYAPQLVNQPAPFFGDEGDVTYPLTTNSLGYEQIGFRDDGLDQEVFAVVVGDSFTSCVGVVMSECWVELLEDSFDKDFANLGVIGYGPQQELQMLTQYGLPLEPEVVVWVFFINDIIEAQRVDQFGSGGLKTGKFWESPIRTWLAKNSITYALFTFFIRNRYYLYYRGYLYNEVNAHDVAWALAGSDLNVAENAAGFQLAKKAMLAAKEITEAESKDTTFVVVLLPFKEQLYETEAAYVAVFDNLSTSLTEFGAENNILVFDLTAEMRREAQHQSDLFYFKRDSHFNATGNRIVANLLEQKLEDLLK